jgi:hypothetical protein
MHMIDRMKRTTLILEDSCLEGIRDLARRESKNLSKVVNEILVEGLQQRKSRRRTEFKLSSFPMGRPRVHLGDRDALEALMEA